MSRNNGAIYSPKVLQYPLYEFYSSRYPPRGIIAVPRSPQHTFELI